LLVSLVDVQFILWSSHIEDQIVIVIVFVRLAPFFGSLIPSLENAEVAGLLLPGATSSYSLILRFPTRQALLQKAFSSMLCLLQSIYYHSGKPFNPSFG
jgi:hypothetical protein